MDDERLYRALRRIRRLEEEVARVYPTDKVRSPIHLSIGQEAVSVGVCEALRPDDVVFGTYRGHALYLAKGGDLRAMVAELYGKVTGCARGKGGSMHLIETSAGMLGTSAVVASTIPHAVGWALAMKYKGSDRIAASFFGDGAVEEGDFHESVGFAALRKLPVLFVAENNLYAIHSHVTARQHLDNLCDRMRTYGIPAKRIDGSDVRTIVEEAAAAVDDIRAGKGPRLLECMTYRWKEHVGPADDWHLGYRAREEAEPWFKNDPVKVTGARLPVKVRERIDREVEDELADAFRFAEESPDPPPEELLADVFLEGIRG